MGSHGGCGSNAVSVPGEETAALLVVIYNWRWRSGVSMEHASLLRMLFYDLLRRGVVAVEHASLLWRLLDHWRRSVVAVEETSRSLLLWSSLHRLGGGR
jgi:hypothetical protein